ncbi:CEP55 protein, partial [Amia calva]|nr:CEP55 protein [Amia calva]
MTSRNAKDNIVNKLGLKLGSSKHDVELDKLRKENALLKKTVDEMTHRKGKNSDSERNKLLEKILALETLKEKITGQLLSKDKEIVALRQQLKAGCSENVAALHAQLEEKNKEAEKREQLFSSISEETKNLKNKQVAVSAKCQELEIKNGENSTSNGQFASSEIATVQEHLRDALEKNQQWLVYDQQREAHVQGMLARISELEQQFNQANQALQQQHKESNSEENKYIKMQEYYDKLLLMAKRDKESQKEAESLLQEELSVWREKYEEKSKEVTHLLQQLQSRRVGDREDTEERTRVAERADRLRAELNVVKARLEEERTRSSELSSQVNLLQKSLLNQNEEQKRLLVLEQQMQMSTKDFEIEKLDRQSLQHQLHKVLKELRKAREQINRLETTKQLRECRLSEPSSSTRAWEERSPAECPGSSPRPLSLLDESFLECPKCKAQYPTSQHRELLAHLDYCSD